MKEIMKDQIQTYKGIRHLLQDSDFYRLISPFESNEAAWMFVSKDKKEIYVCYSRILAKPNPPFKKLKLKGLDTEFVYKLKDNVQKFGGDELMYIGVNVPRLKGDFQSVVWHFNS